MSRDYARYARSGAWSVVAHAAQVVGALIVSIVVVRSLGPADFGILSQMRLLSALAVILSGLGLERAALRFIPELVERKGYGSAVGFFKTTAWIRVGVWVPLMGLTFLAGDGLDRFFRVPVAEFALVAVFTALIFSLHNHIRACATARFATRTVAQATALGAVTTLGTTLLLLQQGQGIAAPLWGAGVGMLVASAVMLPVALDGGGEAAEAPFDGYGFRTRVTAFTLPFAGITLLNFLVHSPTEILLLGHYRTQEDAGYFRLGFDFAQRVIDFLPLALWEVSVAGFSRIAVQDPARLRGALETYLVLLYLAMAPLVMLGVAFSPAVIRWLYTADMAPAIVVSQSYFVMAGYAALGAPIGMIVYARERVGEALKAYAVFALANLALDLALIPKLGLWGAILGLGGAKLLAVLLMARIAWNEIPHLRIPWRTILKAYLAASPVLVWLLLDERFSALWMMFVAVLVSLGILVVSYRLLRVVGPREAALISDTRLPLRSWLLRLLATGSAAT